MPKMPDANDFGARQFSAPQTQVYAPDAGEAAAKGVQAFGQGANNAVDTVLKVEKHQELKDAALSVAQSKAAAAAAKQQQEHQDKIDEANAGVTYWQGHAVAMDAVKDIADPTQAATTYQNYMRDEVMPVVTGISKNPNVAPLISDKFQTETLKNVAPIISTATKLQNDQQLAGAYQSSDTLKQLAINAGTEAEAQNYVNVTNSVFDSLVNAGKMPAAQAHDYKIKLNRDVAQARLQRLPAQDQITLLTHGGAAGTQNIAGPADFNQDRYVKTLFGIESNNDPNAFNKRSKASGLPQFTPGTAAKYPGNPKNPEDATKMTLALAGDNAKVLQANGLPVTEANLYLAHQQGAAGASALLSAPDGTSAVDALTPAYGGNKNKAIAAVTQNGGHITDTAAAFAGKWTNEYNKRAGGSASAPGGSTSSFSRPTVGSNPLVAALGPEKSQVLLDQAHTQVKQETATAQTNRANSLSAQIQTDDPIHPTITPEVLSAEKAARNITDDHFVRLSKEYDSKNQTIKQTQDALNVMASEPKGSPGYVGAANTIYQKHDVPAINKLPAEQQVAAKSDRIREIGFFPDYENTLFHTALQSNDTQSLIKYNSLYNDLKSKDPATAEKAPDDLKAFNEQVNNAIDAGATPQAATALVRENMSNTAAHQQYDKDFSQIKDQYGGDLYAALGTFTDSYGLPYGVSAGKNPISGALNWRQDLNFITTMAGAPLPTPVNPAAHAEPYNVVIPSVGQAGEGPTSIDAFINNPTKAAGATAYKALVPQGSVSINPNSPEYINAKKEFNDMMAYNYKITGGNLPVATAITQTAMNNTWGFTRTTDGDPHFTKYPPGKIWGIPDDKINDALSGYLKGQRNTFVQGGQTLNAENQVTDTSGLHLTPGPQTEQQIRTGAPVYYYIEQANGTVLHAKNGDPIGFTLDPSYAKQKIANDEAKKSADEISRLSEITGMPRG